MVRIQMWTKSTLRGSSRCDGKHEAVDGGVAVEGIAQGPAIVGFARLGHRSAEQLSAPAGAVLRRHGHQDRAAGLDETAEIREPLVGVGEIGFLPVGGVVEQHRLQHAAHVAVAAIVSPVFRLLVLVNGRPFRNLRRLVAHIGAQHQFLRVPGNLDRLAGPKLADHVDRIVVHQVAVSKGNAVFRLRTAPFQPVGDRAGKLPCIILERQRPAPGRSVSQPALRKTLGGPDLDRHAADGVQRRCDRVVFAPKRSRFPERCRTCR